MIWSKLIWLVKHAIEHEENSDDATFIIRSTSGNIDIPVILLNAEINSNVFIDNGRGNNRKLLCIHVTTLTTDQKKAIVGLCAFTVTDQNWKIAQDYLSIFSNLGKAFEMTDDLMKKIRRVRVSPVWWQKLGCECSKKWNILEDIQKQ